MSKIFSAEKVTPAYKVTKKLEAIKCDVCGKELKAKPRDLSRKYFEVRIGHRDWGNDSCDSIQTRDICPECIVKYVDDYLKEYEHSSTAYIEIESECLWCEPSSRYYDSLPKDNIVENHEFY